MRNKINQSDSCQITLDDIFCDVSITQRDNYTRMVSILMDGVENKYRKEINDNNLTNLQLMLKKHKVLKIKQDQIHRLNTVTEDLNIKLTSSQCKIQQFKNQLTNKHHAIQQVEEAIKFSQSKNIEFIQSIHSLQLTLCRTCQSTSQFANVNYILAIEKKRIQLMIYKVKEQYYKNMENMNITLKTKEHNLDDAFLEHLQNVHRKVKMSDERYDIDRRKLKDSKVYTSHIDMQYNSKPQLLTSKSKAVYIDGCMQTEIIKQSRLSEYLREGKELILTNERVDQIKYYMSKTPSCEQSPKITKCEHNIMVQGVAQVDTVKFKPPTTIVKVVSHYGCQVELKAIANKQSEDAQIIQLLQQVKSSKYTIQSINQQKYQEMVKIYEQKPSRGEDIAKIEILKLDVRNLQLEINKLKQQINSLRQLTAELNEQVQNYQSISFIQKIDLRLQDQHKFRYKKPIFSKTYSCLYTDSRNRLVHTEPSQYIALCKHRQTYQVGRNNNQNSKIQADDFLRVVVNRTNIKGKIDRKQLGSSFSWMVKKGKYSYGGYRKYSGLKKPSRKVYSD